MKHQTIYYLFFILLLSCASIKENHVYICKSKIAKKFHFTETCDGLNNCRHEVHSVTIEEAKNLGYTYCELEKR